MIDPLTQVEIAFALGVSQGRISQIELSALRKCRAWLKSHGIGPADLADGTESTTALRHAWGIPDTPED